MNDGFNDMAADGFMVASQAQVTLVAAQKFGENQQTKSFANSVLTREDAICMTLEHDGSIAVQ